MRLIFQDKSISVFLRGMKTNYTTENRRRILPAYPLSLLGVNDGSHVASASS
jgi:hypothetical protein